MGTRESKQSVQGLGSKKEGSTERKNNATETRRGISRNREAERQGEKTGCSDKGVKSTG